MKKKKKMIKEEIEEIKQRLIRNDWISWAGNNFSFEGWEEYCKKDKIKSLEYTVMALIEFLEKTYKGR